MARDWFSGVSDQELLGRAARGKDASLPFHTVPVPVYLEGHSPYLCILCAYAKSAVAI